MGRLTLCQDCRADVTTQQKVSSICISNAFQSTKRSKQWKSRSPCHGLSAMIKCSDRSTQAPWVWFKSEFGSGARKAWLQLPAPLHAATPSATALDRAACWGWLCGGKPGLLDKGDPGVCREGRWPLRQLDLLPGFVVEEPYREVPGLHTGLPVQHPEHCAWRTISTTWPTALALQFLEILHYWLIAKCSSTWTWSWSDVESSSWWWKPAVARVPQGDTARLGPRRLFVPAEALHGEATVVV